MPRIKRATTTAEAFIKTLQNEYSFVNHCLKNMRIYLEFSKQIINHMSNLIKGRGQAGQDVFVQWVLKKKVGGYFLEIGSNDPIQINNSYVLEKEYGWKGIMVEYDSRYLKRYLQERPTAIHVMEDATEVDYEEVLGELNPPQKVIDYLQIDLEVSNDSTMGALKQVEKTMMAGYKYAVVTFEHDMYQYVNNDTRARSRSIFENYGYVRVFSDIKNDGLPFEDWYVYPGLVDMERIGGVMTQESLEWQEILKRLEAS